MTQPDLGHLPEVAVRLLDGFGLVVDNRMTPVIPSSQRILAYLALHERPVDRGVLAEALWPDIPVRRAAARLRSALWRLVRPTCPIVETGQSTLGLADSVTVDVTTVRRFAAELATPGPLRRTPPVSLSAELLPGWTERWVTAERDWFQQMCLRTLEALSERFRADGDHFHAHEAAEAAVRLDPLRESAYRKLIELHLSDHNPAAALRQYTTYRRRLHTELGLQPSPEIHRLLEPVLPRRNVR
jgi:DNA-binding SARP family transcriptional activator